MELTVWSLGRGAPAPHRIVPHVPTDTATLGVYQVVFDRIVGSCRLGTKLLEVPEFHEDCGGHLQCGVPGICRNCMEGSYSGHAELRKQAWTTLPGAFGLKG